jgi:hypothetical protein
MINKAPGDMRKKIFIGLILSVGIFILFFGIGNRHVSVSIGNEGILDSGGEVTPVAIDQASYNAFSKARLAKDNTGITQLILQGRLFSVEKNTKVKVIDQETFVRKIRILTGKFKDEAGWVAADYVKPPTP